MDHRTQHILGFGPPPEMVRLGKEIPFQRLGLKAKGLRERRARHQARDVRFLRDARLLQQHADLLSREAFGNQDAVLDDLALAQRVENLSRPHRRMQVILARLDLPLGVLDLAQQPEPERAYDQALLREQVGDLLERRAFRNFDDVMDFGRLTGHAEGAITVGGHRADEHEGSHERNHLPHPLAFRSTTVTAWARAASSRSICLPPACAISGRPPPVPPISAASGLMSSPAGNRAARSFVTATSSEALSAFTVPSTTIPDLSLSRT